MIIIITPKSHLTVKREQLLLNLATAMNTARYLLITVLVAVAHCKSLGVPKKHIDANQNLDPLNDSGRLADEDTFFCWDLFCGNIADPGPEDCIIRDICY